METVQRNVTLQDFMNLMHQMRQMDLEREARRVEDVRRHTEELTRIRAEMEQKRIEAEQKRADAEQKRVEENARIRAEMEQKRIKAEQKRADAEQKRAEEDARIRAEAEKQRTEINEQRADAEKKRAEEDAKYKREMREINRQLGKLGNRLGEFVQEMVYPAAVDLFRARGLNVHQVMRNVRGLDDNGRTRMEIDLLVINNSELVAIECKSEVIVDDIKRHLERLTEFKDAFPQYKNYRVLGAVAGMVWKGDGIVEFAEKAGFFALMQSGDMVQLGNSKGFEPHIW
ncbi:MAG: hypothetical protein RIR79_2274 [Pseudomonadota bacterium]|jgi:hypothetical protein